jgi:histidinol dehydrogenase
MVPIIPATDKNALNKRLMNRSQLADETVSLRVKEIVDNVREKGDAALLEYTERFDKVSFHPSDVKVTAKEIALAYEKASPEWISAMQEAKKRISAFHEKQKQKTWLDFEEGIHLGQMIRPLQSVGVYVPGGTAAYPSSVLMNVIPAKVAGVKKIVMVTPPGSDGTVSYPLTLVAADIAGVDEIYKVGGAQAIAALAFGTETVPRVDKIVGPGNIYVANAKREVFGHVGIDMVAGPSEVLVIADGSANPVYVAADLLSQAEHDALSAVVLVTPSRVLAQAVAVELDLQVRELDRKEIADASLGKYGTIVLTEDLMEAAQIANEVAPEHLELCVADPYSLLPYIHNAGAIFLGHYSPEPLGDYFAGPNHVLPTSGTARFFSPLSVDDFVKKSSLIFYEKEALREAAEDIILLARREGLQAHAKAVAVRFGLPVDDSKGGT